MKRVFSLFFALALAISLANSGIDVIGGMTEDFTVTMEVFK